MNNPLFSKRASVPIALRIYGAALLAHALLSLGLWVLEMFFALPRGRLIEAVTLAAVVGGLTLYIFPLNVIIGYGLLRLRKWGLDLALVCLALFPVSLLATALFWGNDSPLITRSFWMGLSATITGLFFYFAAGKIPPDGYLLWPQWKRLIIYTCVIVLCSTPLTLLVATKAVLWKPPEAFFRWENHVPPLSKAMGPGDNLIRIELLNMSFSVPPGTRVIAATRSDEKWELYLKNTEQPFRGLFIVSNASLSDAAAGNNSSFLKHGRLADAGTPYELEKFVFTNNWNPMAYTFRAMEATWGDDYRVHSFSAEETKGFVRLFKRKQERQIIVSVFGHSGARLGEFTHLAPDGSMIANQLSQLVYSFRLPSSVAGNGTEAIKTGSKRLKEQVDLFGRYYRNPNDIKAFLQFLDTLPHKSAFQMANKRSLLAGLAQKHPGNKDIMEMDRKLEALQRSP